MVRTRCSVWKLEFSRKSKCVGAKARALTVLGSCRATIQCQDLKGTSQRISHHNAAADASGHLHCAIGCRRYGRINSTL